MAPPRKLPRPFEMHWGRGEIVEEASYEGEYHEPAIQLMVYTEGEAAGGYSVRFCSFNHRGMFQRSPLMLGEAEINGLRNALKATPRLREVLRRLIDDSE
jgi:hypothetical protein